MTIVFDLDGTLIDSTGRHSFLLRNIIKEELSIQLPSEFDKDYLDYKACGNSTKAYLKDVLDFDENTCEKMSLLWMRDIENKSMLELDCLYLETLKVLQYFQNINATIYFLTARRNREYLMDELTALGIKEYAKQIFVVSPRDACKEKREILEKIKNEKMLFIGDTEVDYKAAQECGIPAVILNRGFRNKEYWNKYNIKTYDNILQYIYKNK